MLDAKGDHYDLFVFSKNDLDEMIEHADDSSAPSSLLKELKQYKQALCYINPDNPTLPKLEHWDPYLHPIQPLNEEKTYYYSCIRNLIPLQKEKIISYNQLHGPLKD